MKIFIDTNIILETFLLNREFEAEARRILCAIESKKHKGFISTGSFYTLAYQLERHFKKLSVPKDERISLLRNILSGILHTLKVAGLDNKSLERAILTPEFLDLEDSCQYQAALKAGCEYLVTINTKDFQDCTGTTAVVHPVDFAKVLAEQEN